jgi:hypothetical protein
VTRKPALLFAVVHPPQVEGGGCIAADRDQALAVRGEDAPREGIMLSRELAQFLASGRLVEADLAVPGGDGEQLAVG